MPALSLGKLAQRAASWTVIGQIVSQGLGILSSIVLTRLLFPEAFGLTAIIGVFLFGLAMLSDAGIGASIVQNKRGDDPIFLRTAWTLQVLRGGIVSVFAFLLAAPVASFYNEPDLFWLMCVGGLGPFFSGFASISVHVNQRKMTLGPLIRLDLLCQVLQVTITIVWAIIHPSAWALVGGTLARHIIHAGLSHRLLARFHHGFGWDMESFRGIFHYGRWIFLSSALTFVALQTDRLLLGHFFDLAVLGIYMIGVRFIEALNGFQTRLTHSVLFPYFSQLGRANSQQLVATYYRARLPMEALFLSASAVLLVLGSDIIGLIYDERYASAGWMLQLLAIQTAMNLVLTTQETLLFSAGHTYYGFMRSLAKAIWIAVGIPLGYLQFGLPGVVWCVALSEFPTLLVIWTGLIKHGFLKPMLELRALVIFGLLVAIVYLVKNLL